MWENGSNHDSICFKLVPELLVLGPLSRAALIASSYPGCDGHCHYSTGAEQVGGS